MAIIKATINKQAKVRARTVDVGAGIQLTDLSRGYHKSR